MGDLHRDRVRIDFLAEAPNFEPKVRCLAVLRQNVQDLQLLPGDVDRLTQPERGGRVLLHRQRATRHRLRRVVAAGDAGPGHAAHFCELAAHESTPGSDLAMVTSLSGGCRMRFGFLVAAAAMFSAAQIEAATWIRFTAAGTGDVSTIDRETGAFETGPAFYTYSFTVDIEPSDFNEDYYKSTGTTYYGFITGGRPEIFAQTRPGFVTFGEDGWDSPQYGSWTATFSPLVNAIGFPISAPSEVAGIFSYSNGRQGRGSLTAKGSVSRIDVFQVPKFEFPRFLWSETAGPAAAPVPEPDTWGLMILGFGAVGVMLRRAARTQDCCKQARA